MPKEEFEGITCLNLAKALVERVKVVATEIFHPDDVDFGREALTDRISLRHEISLR